MGFLWSPGTAQMYISEVMYSPGGDDIPREFVEVRGTPSATIPSNTYLLFIEGDGNTDFGNTKMYFDLSGLSFGTNGYLAFLMPSSPFSAVAGANVITAGASTNGGWAGLSEYVGSGSSGLDEIESNSMNIILATTPTALTSRPDIDDDDDGFIDDGLGWTIHDGITILDSDDTNEYAYTDLVFARDPSVVIAPSGALIYDMSHFSSSGGGGYVGRIGESTGSTGNDWVYAQVNSGSGATFSSSSISDPAFGGNSVTEVGGSSNILNEVTYSGGSLSVTDEDDLVIATSFTTSDDFECHDLTINSGQTLTIQDAGSFDVYGAFINNGTVIVESGGTLWTFSYKENDAATFERNTTYADGRYSFVGSPVEASSSITGSDLGPISYYHDETEDYDSDDGLSQWKNASAVELVPGVGYAQAGQELLSFTGVPNDGTIEVPVTHTVATSTTAGNRGFNLVSNPYPSSINGADFFTENTAIDGSIYLWDDGGSDDGVRQTSSDYIIANSAGYVSGGSDRILNGGTPRYQGDIRSFQGFFVRLSDDAGSDNAATVSFTEDMRNGGDNNDSRFFRTAIEFASVKLSLSTASGHYDEALVAFIDDATPQKDRLYDAMKLSSDKSFQFYSLLNGEKHAIQGLPNADVSTDLGFDIEEGLDLTIGVQDIQGIAPGRSVLLTDKLTGQVFDLADIREINFEAEAGNFQNRFTLSYDPSAVLAIDEALVKPIFRFNGEELTIDFGRGLNVEGYAIYDISGRVLLERSEAKFTNELVIRYQWDDLKILKINSQEVSITQKFLFD